MTTKVTTELFRNLTNPYTGRPMEVVMVVNPGRDPLFTSPDTYSTDDTFPTREECIAAWDRKDGISGLKKGRPITCAYTGEPLKLVSCVDGWRFAGGFNPHMFFSRDEFLRLAGMRDGTPRRSPQTAVRVTAVRADPRVSDVQRAAAEAARPSLSDEKLHDLENRFNKRGIRVSPGSVSMSTGRKKVRGK